MNFAVDDDGSGLDLRFEAGVFTTSDTLMVDFDKSHTYDFECFSSYLDSFGALPFMSSKPIEISFLTELGNWKKGDIFAFVSTLSPNSYFWIKRRF